MAVNHVVSVDSEGHLIYKGLLTAKEKATVKEIYDVVIVEIINKDSGKNKEGRIVKVLDRNLSTVVGEICFENNT